MMNIEIDLETLGVVAGHVILSIGACRFDHNGTVDEEFTFYRVCNRADQITNYGMIEDPKTLAWWADQPADAKALLDQAADAIQSDQFKRCLEALAIYIEGASEGEEALIWSNGANFDIAMLEWAYWRCGLPCPWKHYQTRCHRTLKNYRPEAAASAPQYGTTHHALHDAIYQAHQAVRVIPLLAPSWPDTGSLVMPRNFEDKDADPVLDVLAEACKPWGMAAVWNNLRLGGMDIPHRMEAEMATSLHFMLGHAMRNGHGWRKSIVTELREMQARGLSIALASINFSPVLDS